jgi:hypothetical protein
MAKTRSQTGNVAIKKEEEEEDCKPSLRLGSVSNTRTSSRIAKRKPSIINTRTLPAQQVKVEEDIDTKSIIQSSPSSSKLPKGQTVSQEQINQLIHYIVNDNMSKCKALRKVNISERSGTYYYNMYRNDPEKKIPVPRNRFLHPRKRYTQEHIGNLIRYITQDKMTVKEATAKANISSTSGKYYYAKYLKDPDHNIPVPQLQQHYTQDQKNKLLDYIINDKMSIPAAAKKAKVYENTGGEFYYKYFKEQNPDVPTPSHVFPHKCYTQEQIKELISYIVDDKMTKMTIKAASEKANFSSSSASTYCHQYLKDNNMTFPLFKNTKAYSQDKKKKMNWLDTLLMTR